MRFLYSYACRRSGLLRNDPFQPDFWRANSIWSLNDHKQSKIDPPFASSDRNADSGNGVHSETPPTDAIIKALTISRIKEYGIVDGKKRNDSGIPSSTFLN